MHSGHQSRKIVGNSSMTDEEKEARAKALIEKKLSSQAYRLSNLYWVEDENGKKVKFRPRLEQRELHNNLHDQTVVLKCRQPGISTYCGILDLDFSLFCSNKTSGIIDKTELDAKRKLARIKFAYEHLDDPAGPGDGEDTSRIGAMIKQTRILTVGNVTELAWSNGSKIWAGTNLRGGTLQFLWITELGFTSFFNPRDAENIKKGALNTIHPGNRVIIESTHEGGKFGVFYSLVKLAMEAREPLTALDWRFVFFAWHRHVEYVLPLNGQPLNLTTEEKQYFVTLKERGIKLTPEQMHWYVKKKATQGDSMLSEFPSTEEECFEAVIKGAIYGKIISQIRAARRIVDFEYDRTAPMYTFWDIGYSDFTTVWLIQLVGRDICALEFASGCREDPAHYVNIVRSWEQKYNMTVPWHYLPHDADKKELSAKSYRDYLRDAGLANVKVVIRTPDRWLGIHHLRSLLPRFYFHKTNCGREWIHEGRVMPSGIGCLEGYHTKEDASSGVIKEEPVHDDTSHGCDGLRTFAEAEMRGMLEGTSMTAKMQAMEPRRTILAGYNRAREQTLRSLPRARGV